MKVFIDPPNSLVLFDLVERFGHEPLSTMAAIQERVDNLEVDMPPMNVTLDDVVKGLKYAGVEVPSGIRGRMALWGPMIEEADAAAHRAASTRPSSWTTVPTASDASDASVPT